MTVSSVLHIGRTAFRKQQWRDAFNHLSQANEEGLLEPADLEILAVTAYLTGEVEISDDMWAKAHKGFLKDGNIQGAVRCAFWLGFALMNRGEPARGGGWIGLAGDLLQDVHSDCVEEGYLLLPVALQCLGKGDSHKALNLFIKTGEIGKRFHDADLQALARLGQGQSLTRIGNTEEGVALLDQAMIAIESGDLSPIVVGIIYCAVIETCMDIVDLGRAAEWTAALNGWCNSHPHLVPFRGQCLIRRSEIMFLHGEWNEALQEARKAADLLSHPNGEPAAGAAFYQLGNLYRVRGEFANAEEAYFLASDYGRDPQPGLALLRLAQGKNTLARSSIVRALIDTGKLKKRCESLLACTEIMLALNEKGEATEAVKELKGYTTTSQSPMIQAFAAQAEGSLLLTEDNIPLALSRLRAARRIWDDLHIPYASARTRVLMGLAYQKAGDPEAAAMEFEAARTIFERLKARPDIVNMKNHMDRPFGFTNTLLTPREKDVLRLMTEGKSNNIIAGELFISKRTVERHVSNIFAKLDLNSRTEAVAYAFRHHLFS